MLELIDIICVTCGDSTKIHYLMHLDGRKTTVKIWQDDFFFAISIIAFGCTMALMLLELYQHIKSNKFGSFGFFDFCASTAGSFIFFLSASQLQPIAYVWEEGYIIAACVSIHTLHPSISDFN